MYVCVYIYIYNINNYTYSLVYLSRYLRRGSIFCCPLQALRLLIYDMSGRTREGCLLQRPLAKQVSQQIIILSWSRAT